MLIDPVCMLTIYPQLLRNFVYKGPNFATISSLLGIVDSLRFVFSRDLMVAEVSRLSLHPHRWSHSPTKPSYSIASFPCKDFSPSAQDFLGTSAQGRRSLALFPSGGSSWHCLHVSVLIRVRPLGVDQCFGAAVVLPEVRVAPRVPVAGGAARGVHAGAGRRG